VQQPVPTAEVTNGSVNAAVQVTIMNNGVAANDENGILESSNSTLMEARVFETIDEDTKMDESTETEAKEERPKCQICEENEADVAFKPCGHIVVCAGTFFFCCSFSYFLLLSLLSWLLLQSLL